MLPLYLLLCGTLLASSSLIYRGWRNGVTPVPSSGKAARLMAETAEEELSRISVLAGRPMEGMTVVEAGAGWGGPALRIARRLPAVRIIGYENSPLPYLVSRVRAWIGADRNIELRYGSFLAAEGGEADLIVCYLFPEGMRRLDRCLNGAVRRGYAPVLISNTYTIPGRRADRTLATADLARSTLYIYRYRR